MVLFVLQGCRSDPPVLHITLETVEAEEEDLAVAPAYRVTVGGPEGPARVTIRGAGELRTVDLPAAQRTVDLYGLPASTGHVVTAVVGEQTAGASFVTPPLPEGLPPLEVLANEPDRVEPGLLLFAAEQVDTGASAVLLLDEHLRVRWWLQTTARWSFATIGLSGELLGLVHGGIEERSWDGRLLFHATATPHDPGDVALARALDHELVPLEDGTFWSITKELVTFDGYPPSYEELEPIGPPTDVEDTPVVRIGADGTELSAWPLSERLDPGRVSYNARAITPFGGRDWVHANGVVPDGTGGVIVSARNQDAVFRLDANGDLDWILADPGGWHEPWASHLLRPDGELRWPYHQHAPQWLDDGTVVVFDNVGAGCNPYGTCPEDPGGSRAVAYRVDPVARTVRQLWELDRTTTGPLLSEVLGNADLLPRTGNVLATWGAVDDEPDRYSARLLEWELARPELPVRDLRVGGPTADHPAGWRVYRSERAVPGWAGWPPRPVVAGDGTTTASSAEPSPEP